MTNKKKVGTQISVYRIFDGQDKRYEWFGDIDDIILWLKESQIEQLGINEEELNERGWVWGLEQAGVAFEEIYSKEVI